MLAAAQSKRTRCTPQGDAELTAKEQVLRFKPARRLEEVDDEHCERMQEREHRPQSCDDSTRRCDSQAGWNFRKGQVRNLSIDVKRTLKVPVRVKEGGRTRAISTQEGALMMLRDKALKGDARALDRLLEFAARFNNDAGEIGMTQALSADDQAILAAYAAESRDAAKPPTTTEFPGDATPDPAAASDAKAAE
jgi:Family of unknown function (DUF5681)